MEHVDPSSALPPKMTREIVIGEKLIASWCAQGAMVPLSKNPGLDKIRFLADPDKTPVGWFDGNRRAATKLIEGFVDNGIDPEPVQIKTTPIDGASLKASDFMGIAGVYR